MYLPGTVPFLCYGYRVGSRRDKIQIAVPSSQWIGFSWDMCSVGHFRCGNCSQICSRHSHGDYTICTSTDSLAREEHEWANRAFSAGGREPVPPTPTVRIPKLDSTPRWLTFLPHFRSETPNEHKHTMRLSIAFFLLSSATAFSPSWQLASSSASRTSSSVYATKAEEAVVTSNKPLIPPVLSETDIPGLYNSNVQTTYG
jgi:hypothetical protein